MGQVTMYAPKYIGYVIIGFLLAGKGWKWWEVGFFGMALGLVTIK